MSGFITHYTTGIEAVDKMSDNYIRELIARSNHAFLVGLQGMDIFQYTFRSKSHRSLSYRTAGSGIHNQEYAAFFNSMCEAIDKVESGQRDACLAYMAGFLCYYAGEKTLEPYIAYRTGQRLPTKSRSSQARRERAGVETTIDTVLLRSHFHLEPSQLNFGALTYLSRHDAALIGTVVRRIVRETYNCRISNSEVASGLKALRRSLVCVRPDRHYHRNLMAVMKNRIIYEDYMTDSNDYMNAAHRPWYPYLGCMEPVTYSFEEIYQMALMHAVHLLDSLDSYVSWGMHREELISEVIDLNPYAK